MNEKNKSEKDNFLFVLLNNNKIILLVIFIVYFVFSFMMKTIKDSFRFEGKVFSVLFMFLNFLELEYPIICRNINIRMVTFSNPFFGYFPKFFFSIY